ADDCQPFYVRSHVRNLTSRPFVHRHRVLCTLLFCEQRLRQLWSSKTQASKKVVECSICVTECPVLARGSEVGRAKAARPRRRAARDEPAPPQWIELHLLPQPSTQASAWLHGEFNT